MPLIRAATEADIPRIVEMGTRFRATSDYATCPAENPAQMAAMARYLLATDGGLLLVALAADRVVGMFAALIFPHYFSGERIAGELVWWVEPEARGVGVRLLRRAEAWAIAQGAQRIQLIAPTAQVGHVYERLGYTKIETAYQRTVVPC